MIFSRNCSKFHTQKILTSALELEIDTPTAPALYKKTNVNKYSYFPRTIIEWNSLPQQLYDIHNLDNFKTALVDSEM